MSLIEKDFFSKESTRILAESERCGLLNHRHSEGSSREDILIKLLTNVLPEQYGICKGIVFYEDKKSKQIDVIVYKKYECYKLPISDYQYMIPLESVVCVIEVKSSLTKKELIGAIKNVQSVLNLYKLSIQESIEGKKLPFTIIFAYNLYRCSLKSICENLNEILKKENKTLVNSICILKKGVLNISGEHNVDKEFIQAYGYDKYEIVKDENSSYQLYSAIKTCLSRRSD